MAGSFLGEGLTDLANIFSSSGTRRRIVQPSIPQPEFTMPPYGWNTQYGVDPYSGMPILPGSDYGPPPAISPSDRFNVKHTLEDTNFGNPVEVVSNFGGNLLHGLGTAFEGLTGLIGMAYHDTIKTLAPFVPGDYKIEKDDYDLTENFLVPMLGIGNAKSQVLEDWKYRYGFTDNGFDLGKVGRGLYEQPFSFINDALMVGGGIGKAAKAVATRGELAFATRQAGSAAVEAAQVAAKEFGGSSSAPIFITETQKAAMAARTRPTWLTSAMDLAALTPDDKFLGALKSKTFEVPIGPLNEVFSRPLSSNPVARTMRLAIYKNPVVAVTFDTMDAKLRALTGGYGYDAYVERLQGGSFGTGIENPGLAEAFGNLGDAAVPARRLFMRMQRMVEDTSEALPQSYKYNIAFREHWDKILETRLFNNAKSAIQASGIVKRKAFEQFVVKTSNDAHAAMDDMFGKGVLDTTNKNRVLVGIAEGMIDDEAVLARQGISPDTPYAGLKPLPAEWNNVTHNPPPAVAYDDGNIYNFDRVIKPITMALGDSREGFAKYQPNPLVQERTLNLPSGPRRVVSAVVPTLDDIQQYASRIEEVMGAKREYVIDTFDPTLPDDMRLVRTTIVGYRLPDNSLVEVAFGNRHSTLAAHASSAASKLLFGLLDDFEQYVGDGAILDNQYAAMQTLEQELGQLRSSLSALTDEKLVEAQKAIAVRDGRLTELREQFGRNIETTQALQRNISDGYAFVKTQLNEGVSNLEKYGSAYNPMWKWRDEMSVNWWNQVLEKEMGADPSHRVALDFSTHMKRIYRVRQYNKIYKVMNEFGHDLKRFLDGDFIDEIGRMPPNVRQMFVQSLGVSERVGQAIMAGDRIAMQQFFSAAGAADPAAALANKVAAFMHMHKMPTPAVETVINRLLTGIEEGPVTNTIKATRDNLGAIDIVAKPEATVGESILSSSATLDGHPLWDEAGNLNTSVAAQAIKRYVERKVVPVLEEGNIEGFRWQDLHDEWHVQQGMPTPIYFPHMPKPKAGAMHMSLGSDISQIHPRDTWLRKWDGDLLQRGIYDKNFTEVWAHRATQIIRHQQVAEMFKEAKRFSRKVSPRELDLWDAGWMDGEKLWNPEAVDAGFRLTRQAHQTMMDLVDEGMNIDDATTQTIKEIMPDAFAASLRATTGELYAVPSHIAQRITFSARLNLPWQVRMFYDGPIQVWRTSVLAFSPRWIVNNTLGNTVFQLIKNPRAVLETIKMYDSEYRAMWEHVGGGAFPEGVDRGFLFEQGNIIESGKYGYAEAAAPGLTKNVRSFMSSKPVSLLSKKAEWMRQLNGVVEDAARRGVFAAEYKALVKQNIGRYANEWVGNAQVMERIMKNGLDPVMAEKALEGVNKILGDYTNLSAAERQIVRRFVFPFYAFWKHSVKFVLSMPLENPYKVAIMRGMDALQEEMWGDDMHDWFQGSVFIGNIGKSDPMWLRTKSMNPLSNVLGGVTGQVASMSPIIRAIFENQTGINTFTGDRYSTADTFETPTGQVYRYVKDSNGKLLGVRLLNDDEKVTPSWFDAFASMWPQYGLVQNGIIDYMQGEAGARYSGTGDTIMENGKPKYPTPIGSAFASYFGFPVTTFDPNDYLYRQYRGYWRSALPMAQSRLQEQTGQPVQMGVMPP